MDHDAGRSFQVKLDGELSKWLHRLVEYKGTSTARQRKSSVVAGMEMRSNAFEAGKQAVQNLPSDILPIEKGRNFSI